VSELTKAQAKLHEHACTFLAKDALTFDEREYVLEHWRADANQDVQRFGAFFTPPGLAETVAMECNGAESVIDLCAGIGALSYWRWRHDCPRRLVCVEANPVYVAVGRKVLPEAHWIQADVFSLLERTDLGQFDLAISNPPFGRLSRSGSGPRYSGSLFELHVMDIAGRLADQGAFIIPPTSTPFQFSHTDGVDYRRANDPKAYNQFFKETGIAIDLGVGVDTSEWRADWHGVKPFVESVRVDYGLK
jgi:hypothetical protein